MIKKIRLLVVLCLLSVSSVFGQATSQYNDKQELLWEAAKDLYDKGMYVSAQKMFSQILLHQGMEYATYKDDAAYYIAICAMNLYNDDTEYQLQSFIDQHPESRNSNYANFKMANLKFRSKKYKNAIELYNKVDRLSLNSDERAEYHFKLGFCYFARKDYELAAKTFYEAKDVSGIYGNMSLYFYSHIKYINKQYQTALNGFVFLKDKPAFSSIVPFYIVQIYFLQEKYDDVISIAKPMIDTVAGIRKLELYKLLGGAHYKKAEYKEAIPYLKEYLEKASSSDDNDFYELGFSYYAEGKYELAAINFSKIKKAKGEMSQNAAYHMGDCYLKLDKKIEARRAFEKAAQYDFNADIQEDALFNFAQLCFELSLSPFNETINAFNLYIKKFPNSHRIDKAYDMLVNALLCSKNYQEAISIIEKVPDRNNKIDEAYQRLTYNRGLELFTASKYQDAITNFDKSIKFRLYDIKIGALAYYWKAEAYYRMKQVDKAIPLFKSFVSTKASVSLEEFDIAHYNLAYAYFNKKDYKTANSWFRKYEMQVGNVSTVLLNDVLNRIGDCYYISKDFDLASKYYKKAFSISKHSPDYSLYQMALSYGAMGMNKQKIWSLKKLLNEFPQSEYCANAVFEIGRVYHVAENNSDSARLYYSRVLVDYKKSSMHKAAMSSLGVLYFNERDYTSALETFKDVISTYPKTEEARNAKEMIKAIYIEMDKPNEYIEYAKKTSGGVSVTQDEQDEIMWLSAKKLYVDKKYDEALSSLSNYLSKFPSGKYYIEANYFKAELLNYFKETDKAFESYKKVADAPYNSYSEESVLKVASTLFDRKDWKLAYDYYYKLSEIASNKSDKLISFIGRMRCAYLINEHNNVIESSKAILQIENIDAELTREAHFKMAKAYHGNNNTIRALVLYESLSKEVVSYEGAESKYRLIEINYNMKKDSIAENIIYEFVKSNSPQAFWIAKSLMLLSDIYYDRQDNFSAKQTLQSVLNNYVNETDGIKDEASEKIQKIIAEEEAYKVGDSFINKSFEDPEKNTRKNRNNSSEKDHDSNNEYIPSPMDVDED